MKKKSIVVITGASSGMGAEFALQIDSHLRKTDEIWLIARNEERLAAVKDMMRNNVKILILDLMKEEEIEALGLLFKLEKVSIRMLVNCAGYGIIGKVETLSTQEQTGMVRLNCEALTHVTKVAIPYMCPGSRIIQLASSAAFVPQPGFAVYAATKSYVNSFSLALRQELKKKKIYVTSVCPGPVDTPFFDRAEKYQGRLAIKNLFLADPWAVVDKALRDSVVKRPKSVYGRTILLFELISKILPHRILLWIMHLTK